MLKVVCGIIRWEGRVFLARKAPGTSQEGRWEFPGGKIEGGESGEQALHRELREELAMRVDILNCVGSVEVAFPAPGIELIGYECTWLPSDIQLTDHDTFRWLLPEELSAYPLSPADQTLWEMVDS